MNYIDRLTIGTKILLRDAIRGWFSGLPQEEVAVMNRITEKFNFNNEAIKLNSTKFTVNSHLKQLHRRGFKGSDKFGCDLAITVLINKKKFCKTAFFQFKVGTSDTFRVENDQLAQAYQRKVVRDSFHLFYINKSNGQSRILDFNKKIWTFYQLKSGSKTTKFDSNTFKDPLKWTQLWLRCKIQQNSFKNNFKIENFLYSSVLRKFKLPEIISKKPQNFEEIDLEYPLARNWLFLNLSIQE